MDEDAASLWGIRLDEGGLTLARQSELDDWLNEDVRRQGLLLRACATLAYLDRGRALAGENEVPVEDDMASSWEPEVDADASEPIAAGSGSGRRGFMIGAAASLLAVGGTGAMWKMLASGEQLDTAVGEIRRVPLADGSIATLNTRSRLDIAMSAADRVIRIEEGEAWFQVAHDKQRPFVVEAGNARIRAVGTAFSVRRHDDAVDVLVTEGVVETWFVGSESDRQQITAGSKAVLPRHDPAISVFEASAEIDRELAWRSGEIALKGEPLSYAIAEMNRYNVVQIEAADSALQKTELVGFFKTTDPETFVKAVSAMTEAKATHQDGRIILQRSAGSEAYPVAP